MEMRSFWQLKQASSGQFFFLVKPVIDKSLQEKDALFCAGPQNRFLRRSEVIMAALVSPPPSLLAVLVSPRLGAQTVFPPDGIHPIPVLCAAFADPATTAAAAAADRQTTLLPPTVHASLESDGFIVIPGALSELLAAELRAHVNDALATSL